MKKEDRQARALALAFLIGAPLLGLSLYYGIRIFSIIVVTLGSL